MSQVQLSNGEFAERVVLFTSPADTTTGVDVPVNSTNPLPVSLETAGIESVHRLLSAANSENATSVKASAGVLFKLEGWNAGTVTYLKLYNKASTPSEADTPLATFYLPASLKFDIDFGPGGLTMGTGIAYRLVTGNADNDDTAVAAAAVLALNVLYT